MERKRLDPRFETVIRLLFRGGELPEIIQVLEIVKEELAKRNIILEYTTEERPPAPGK